LAFSSIRALAFGTAIAALSCLRLGAKLWMSRLLRLIPAAPVLNNRDDLLVPSAIGESGFDVVACRRHLATPEGQGGCMVSGCIARNACPVGADYRYPQAQLAFHMQALTLPG
jgi:hypothetical protein